MFPGLTSEEISAGLDVVVRETLDEAGVQAPPVDAFAVARALGIAIADDDRQDGRARYVRLTGHRGRGSQPAVLLRADPRPERRHWAVAHEIGEHIASRVFAQLGVSPGETRPNAREEVANRLAGRLLLPTAWFLADGRSLDWDLFALKNRYATASHELIARRMLEMPCAAIITIFDQGQIYFRRSNVPGRAPGPSAAEMQCWQSVHQHNQPDEGFDGVSKVRGWPIHEENWKREILRTEVELEYAF